MGTTTQDVSIYTIQTSQPNRVHRLYTFLETAEVYITDAVGNKWPIRVLFDTGATRSVINEAVLRNGLWHRIRGPKSEISGITAGKVLASKYIHTDITNRFSTYTLSLTMLIMSDFTHFLAKPRLPNTLKPTVAQYHKELADTSILTETERIPFDAILGNEVLNALKRTTVKAITSRLLLRKTPFGIVLSGPVEEQLEIRAGRRGTILDSNIFLAINMPPMKIPKITLGKDAKSNQKIEQNMISRTAAAALDRDLTQLVRDFYQREFADFSPGLMSDNKLDEQADLFVTSEMSRDTEGRYMVKLPWKTECMHLLSRNEFSAHKRWTSLMEKFNQNHDLAKTYAKYIQAWIDQGVLVHQFDELLKQTEPHTVIPHHVVIKPTSASHKYRVVCDAAAREKGKLSANDCIAKGPNLLPAIFDILVRVRFGKIISFGDIEKAFLQISLHPSERTKLLLFWSHWAKLQTNDDAFIATAPEHRFKAKRRRTAPHKTETPQQPTQVESICERHLYAFHRLPWGLNVSPFILLKVIRTHLRDNFSEDQHSSKLTENILRNLYMDDLVSTYDTAEECITEFSFAIKALLDAKFPLKKICSNTPAVWEYFNQNFPEHAAPPATKPESRVLGTLYSAEDDYVRPDVAALKRLLSPRVPFLTARSCLKAHSIVFDPLGLVGHWHFTAKKLMQEVHFSGIKRWDDPIDKSLEQQWFDWIESYKFMEHIKVPRFVAPVDTSQTDYHIFVDASEIGYAACAYAVYNDQSALICSQAKVVPKQYATKASGISIPRIELLGAELGARLWEKIRLARHLNSELVRPTFWSDSQTALWWIRSLEGRYKIFVSNRVASIRRVSSPEQWRFVPGKQNPADLATRGMPAVDACSSKEWYHGPSWLADRQKWPAALEIPSSHSEGEVELTNVMLTFDVPTGIAPFELAMLSTSCSLWPMPRLTKIWGYVSLWIGTSPRVKGKLADICRHSTTDRPEYVKKFRTLQEHYRKKYRNTPGAIFSRDDRLKFCGELRDAHSSSKNIHLNSSNELAMRNSVLMKMIAHYLIDQTQKHYFPNYVEAISLPYNDKLDLPDKIRRPIIELGLVVSDKTGLIVSQGRLNKNSRKLRRQMHFQPQKELPDVTKELILIPSIGLISESIMYNAHLHTSHGGQSAMTHATRDEYWILSASRAAKSVKRACTLCKLFDQPALVSEPGDLPFERFSPSYPFQHIGLDYAFLKCGYDMVDTSKGLVMCLFTCMVTRAVHLELSTDMSGPEFARVFETFCNARNVIPETIVSDNGSNFSPVIKHLLHKWKTATDPKYRRIFWKALPRKSPKWGGFYERLVGVFKDKFVKEFPTLKFNNLLEVYSALKRIEARMNQRPLGAVGMDRNDPDILTPASFLVVAPTGIKSQPDFENLSGLVELSRGQQAAVDQLWHQFYLSYLCALRIHHKWNKRQVRDLQVGDLVMTAVDKVKARTQWPVGKVREIVFDTRQNKPKAAIVDMYSPTLGNTPLKNKLFGIRTPYYKLSVEQRSQVVGCFKLAKHSTPIDQLYPYEMWRAPPVSLTLKPVQDPADTPPANKKARMDKCTSSGTLPRNVVDEDEVTFMDDDGHIHTVTATPARYDDEK